MKIEDLQKYFDKAKAHEITFKGSCHDCGVPVCIDINVDSDNKMNITGGPCITPR